MSLNLIVKELRINRNLTLKQLSEGIGYSSSVINDWELKKKQPTAGAIIALAKYFDVTADYLLGIEKGK